MSDSQTNSTRPFVQRTYAGRVMADTITNYGAKFGLFWIATVAALCVLAPLLANSHPLLMKSGDHISSPMLRHLTKPDAILLVLAIVAGILLGFKPMRVSKRFRLFLMVAMVVVPLCLWLVHPPQAVVYEKYRQMQTAGEIEWAIRAPIPFSPTDRLRDMPDLEHPIAPAAGHLMGTERNGADILSRMIHASRIAMSVGFISTGIALIIGVTIGGIMGYFSGAVDILGMRLVEIFSAIPTLFLLLAFVAFFPRNLYIMMAIIGLTSWVGYAIFVRAEFLKLRQQDFVQAGIACGLPLRSILFKHMLPNGVSPVLVSASFGIAGAILAEAMLSFLGLGLVDKPSWGQLLSQAVAAGGGFYWWIALFPGTAIFFTVFAYNLIGEALRDAIDPHLKKAAQL